MVKQDWAIQSPGSLSQVQIQVRKICKRPPFEVWILQFSRNLNLDSKKKKVQGEEKKKARPSLQVGETDTWQRLEQLFPPKPIVLQILKDWTWEISRSATGRMHKHCSQSQSKPFLPKKSRTKAAGFLRSSFSTSLPSRTKTVLSCLHSDQFPSSSSHTVIQQQHADLSAWLQRFKGSKVFRNPCSVIHSYFSLTIFTRPVAYRPLLLSQIS